MSASDDRPDLRQLPDMMLDGDEPVFSEPWEAQAFALTVSLYDKGMFSWDEWATSLSAEIHSGAERSYYRHWLVALEKLVAAKKITSMQDIDDRERAWHAAAARTPHGEPIEL